MSVIQNSQYTFEYISSVDFHNDNSNPYAGGSFWYNGLELTTHDLTFTANIAQATLGVTEVELSNKKINLFPNPTTNFIQISGLSKKENYKIYNILGVEIKKGEISNNEKIKIKNFSNDLYFLKLENGNTLKFIKN
ncbi:MAG: T9SS type A sorting domain-containing protein [Flavobacteriaceae bacterium]|nr:T9SS type A sorting domain-containing protein [Flavobacteriaceae bacterium]